MLQVISGRLRQPWNKKFTGILPKKVLKYKRFKLCYYVLNNEKETWQ